MCKTHTTTYTCTHTVSFRLSTCHATYTAPFSKRRGGQGRDILCKALPALTLRSQQACGSCRKVEGGDGAWRRDERGFPDAGFKKAAKRIPVNGCVGSRRVGSLLREEVLAEDVVESEKVDGSWNGGWEWTGDYPSLADEIAEDRGEVDPLEDLDVWERADLERREREASGEWASVAGHFALIEAEAEIPNFDTREEGTGVEQHEPEMSGEAVTENTRPATEVSDLTLRRTQRCRQPGRQRQDSCFVVASLQELSVKS